MGHSQLDPLRCARPHYRAQESSWFCYSRPRATYTGPMNPHIQKKEVQHGLRYSPMTKDHEQNPHTPTNHTPNHTHIQHQSQYPNIPYAMLTSVYPNIKKTVQVITAYQRSLLLKAVFHECHCLSSIISQRLVYGQLVSSSCDLSYPIRTSHIQFVVVCPACPLDLSATVRRGETHTSPANVKLPDKRHLNPPRLASFRILS